MEGSCRPEDIEDIRKGEVAEPLKCGCVEENREIESDAKVLKRGGVEAKKGK